MKSRKVVTRTGRGFRAYVPSFKLGRMVEAESILERNAIALIEFSRGVVNYQEQPELILYEFKGEIKRYFPDFEVVLRSGEIIHIEVKPRSKLESLELREKLTAVAQHYERGGRNFRILTDDQIRINPTLLANIHFLIRFQFHEGDFSRIKNEILKTLKEFPESTISSLREKHGLVNVLVLISRHELMCDLNLDLRTQKNTVWLPKGEDDDSLLF